MTTLSSIGHQRSQVSTVWKKKSIIENSAFDMWYKVHHDKTTIRLVEPIIKDLEKFGKACTHSTIAILKLATMIGHTEAIYRLKVSRNPETKQYHLKLLFKS